MPPSPERPGIRLRTFTAAGMVPFYVLSTRRNAALFPDYVDLVQRKPAVFPVEQNHLKALAGRGATYASALKCAFAALQNYQKRVADFQSNTGAKISSIFAEQWNLICHTVEYQLPAMPLFPPPPFPLQPSGAGLVKPPCKFQKRFWPELPALKRTTVNTLMDSKSFKK